MNLPPRNPDEPLLNGWVQANIWIRSLIAAAATLAALELEFQIAGDSSRLTTIGFTTLSMALLLQAWAWASNARASARQLWSLLSCPSMVVTMFISYALLFMAIYSPGLQTVLSTVALTWTDLSIASCAAILSALLSEFVTFMVRPIITRVALLARSYAPQRDRA